jgi:ABC-type cobalamin/Fe3+-siderophores transport system ATPase subunit
MIEVQGARITVGANRTLLRDVSFSVRSGELIALLGANGVGKTTLLRALAGLHVIAEGSAILGGDAVHNLDPRERARSVAFVQSDAGDIDDVSVRDAVATGRFAFHRWWEWRETRDDDDAVGRALQAVDLAAMEHRRVHTLSSGERQRVWLGLALAQESPILLLDEPTSHLDIRVAHEMLALLRAQAHAGKTILCAMHDLNDAAAYADRVMLLGDERVLAFDRPERVLTEPLLERAYGVQMEAIRTSTGGLRVFPISISP